MGETDVSDTKWTPGPWRVSRYEIGGHHRTRLVQDRKPLARIITDFSKWFLAEDFGCDEQVEHEANVRLIAAAPELYEALEKIAEARMPGEARRLALTTLAKLRSTP